MEGAKGYSDRDKFEAIKPSFVSNSYSSNHSNRAQHSQKLMAVCIDRI